MHFANAPDCVKSVYPPPSGRSELHINGCSGLTAAILNNGLEEIGWGAFYRCTSLECIVTPPNVRVIKDNAFEDCSNLATVRECDNIKEFVLGNLMQQDVCDHGVHEKCLSTYCFLVRCNIPEHTGLALPGM